jgi:hypothetical protein
MDVLTTIQLVLGIGRIGRTWDAGVGVIGVRVSVMASDDVDNGGAVVVVAAAVDDVEVVVVVVEVVAWFCWRRMRTSFVALLDLDHRRTG